MTKRTVNWLSVLALLLIAVLTITLHAQSGLTSTTCPGTGCAVFNADGSRAVSIQVAGTFVATVVAEQSNDAINYNPLWMRAINPMRSITGTNPAAAAEISETVPVGSRWKFKGMRAVLTTSATVANRNVTLTIDDGTNTILSGGAVYNQAASAAFTYWFAPGLTNSVQTSVIAQVPIPPTDTLILPSGYRIRTLTGALQAGDDWGAPQYLVEEEVDRTTAAGMWTAQTDGSRFIRIRLSAYTSGTALVNASASR